MDLWRLEAREVVELLRRGEVSPTELLETLEERIQAVDSSINALPILCFERARERALQLEKLPAQERGPLRGLPIAVKDLVDVSGVRSTHGSRIYRDHIAGASDRLVRRIEERGGVIYAKSNTPEFGTGGITFNDVFGITRNPRDTRFTAGGSSGGAAAALAAGCAWLSHGSDMAGSLRTPAAFCGVSSLRPSPGRISADSPLLPFDTLGQEGPMARGIADLSLFAGVLFDEPPAGLVDTVPEPLKPLRIAISRDLGVTRVSEEISAVVSNLGDTLAAAGCEVVESAPEFSGVHEAFDILRAHNYAVSLEDTLAEHPGIVKDEIAWNVEYGLSLDSATIRRGQRMQGAIVASAERFMADFDLLICPATRDTGLPAEIRYPGFDEGVPFAEYYRWLAIVYALTMTALPIVTLPVARASNGLPVGVQLVARRGADVRLLGHALWLERQLSLKTALLEPV